MGISKPLKRNLRCKVFISRVADLGRVARNTPNKVIFSKTGNSKYYCSFSYDRVYFYC